MNFSSLVPLSCSVYGSCNTPLVLLLFMFVRASTQLSFNAGLSFFLVSLSEIGILTAAIGGACGIIFVLLGIFMAVKYCRRKHVDNNTELQYQGHESKDIALL